MELPQATTLHFLQLTFTGPSPYWGKRPVGGSARPLLLGTTGLPLLGHLHHTASLSPCSRGTYHVHDLSFLHSVLSYPFRYSYSRPARAESGWSAQARGPAILCAFTQQQGPVEGQRQNGFQVSKCQAMAFSQRASAPILPLC